MKTLSITIGIPAYNEERNIAKLLRMLVKQRESGFQVEKIIVVSDASTDKTVNEVRKIQDNRITLVKNEARIGQSASQNKIMRMCDQDILVILEADTLPVSEEYLMHLLDPFLSNNKIRLVQGRAVCAKPTTFIGKVYVRNYQALNEMYEKSKTLRKNICTGRGGRALAKDLYTGLNIPSSVPEDLYILLWCKRKRMPVRFTKSAAMFFQPSGTLPDMIKAERKISSGKKSLENHFGKKFVQKHFEKSIGEYLFSFAAQSVLYFITYLFLKSIVVVAAFNQSFTDFWPTSNSTKILSVK